MFSLTASRLKAMNVALISIGASSLLNPLTRFSTAVTFMSNSAGSLFQ